MIHPRAVREFLRQPRDSFVWIKRLSRKSLQRLLDDYDFRPISKEPLDTHQMACVVLGISFPRFAFWLDMGTGKTRIVLELLNHFWRKGILRRGLILAISDEAVSGWEDEIKKWRFKVPYAAIGNSTTVEKWQSVAELGAGLLITTYAGFNYMFAQKQKIKGKRKKKMKPDIKRIRKFAQNLDAFIPDESVHLGNHQSLGFRIAKNLSARCEIVFALAGVPFGRDPTMLWSQMFLVDKGESLGRILEIFRAAFFSKKRGWFKMFDYKFLEKKKPKLIRLTQHRSISYSADECLDLPPVTPVIHKIKLPPETLIYFDRTMEALKAARGDRRQIENLFLRMRQLSSGFIGYRDDETGEKAKLVMPSNPKLDDLMNTIDDMPPDRKIVVFHEFTFSGQLICDALRARKIKHGWLWSGQNNGRKILRAFKEESAQKAKVLLVNHFLGAESLNLQVANYIYAYETPVGVIQRKQMERRCFRKGQILPGFLIDPIATKTDAKILQFHKEGGDLLKSIIRDPFSALNG